MNKNNIFRTIVLMTMSLVLFSSCLDDLDKSYEYDKQGDDVYATFEGYKQGLAKVYAAYALTGNEGPAGKPDISGLDEGQYADFLRMYFNHQEMPTDEAHCIWNDEGVSGLNNLNFSSENPFTKGLYNRCIMQIMYANEFMREAAKAGSKGFSAEQMTEIAYFAQEARFLRAYQYWVLIDLYGNPPFITENSELNTLPERITRKDLFNYLEAELIDLTSSLKDARTNEYGRADKGAAYALLARLYLNAEVYAEVKKYTEAAAAAKKVIESGYSLKGEYEELFFADNNLDNNEVILSINYDGNFTRTHAGTTFLVKCGSNADYEVEYADILYHYGFTENTTWSGYRTRKQFSEKFEAGDKRNMFVGENVSIENPTDYKDGLATYKWRNITRAYKTQSGAYGSHPNFSDIDFPLFRLAEMYLTYAEAAKRGGTASASDALAYMNEVRNRAGVSPYGNYTDFELQDILDERARELYWECHRRTDLIRFDQFTSRDYVWEWKGGVRNGQIVSSHYNLYPIPSSDLMSNPNLKQNLNY